MRALILSTLLLVACGSSSNSPSDMGGQNPDLAPACVTNPMTHVELLNACTNADYVDKTPFYPSKAPNGVLPQLP